MNDKGLLGDALVQGRHITYLESKSDIIDYYQKEYGKSWKKRIIMDLAQRTGKKEKTIEKRFDKQRRGNPEKRNAKEYRDFGLSLPPQRGGGAGTILVTLKGEQNSPRGVKRRRTIKIELSGSAARDFISSPNWSLLWEEYNVEPQTMEEGDYAFECESVTIT